jgi:3-dehydroquinate dehydratase-2
MLVSVIHGPNLNLLGTRRPDVYGSESLADIELALNTLAKELDLELEHFQSNHEGALIDRLQSCRGRADAVILNAAGYTHTSVAIADAVEALAGAPPVIEVHLSIPEAREVFREKSLLARVVAGRVEGFRGLSYLLALRAASALIARRGEL